MKHQAKIDFISCQGNPPHLCPSLHGLDTQKLLKISCMRLGVKTLFRVGEPSKTHAADLASEQA
jgi:hypothetical protein